MSPKRSAFIDVGTNTALCVIADLRETGRFRVLDDLAEITGLGRGVDQTGVISAAGEQKCRRVLERYGARCRDLGVDEIFVVGTSALRDACNSGEVRARLCEGLGFEIRVISGAEEAAYSFLAVQRGLSLPGEVLVIDIGGGSTEFIRGHAPGLLAAVSVDVGSVRLTERFLHSDPVRAEEVRALQDAVDRELAPLGEQFYRPDQALTLVGIAGTFTTLAAVAQRLQHYSHVAVHGSRLSLVEVRRQIRLFQGKTIAQRQRIAGLDPKRADVILAGASMIERVMNLFHADNVVVSDQGVRYGLLHEYAQTLS